MASPAFERVAVRTLMALALCLSIAACAERPRIGVTITNAPTIPDCIPGSATKPCP